MSFTEFSKQYKNENFNKTNIDNKQNDIYEKKEDFYNKNSDEQKNIMEKYNELSGKSHNELLETLFAEVNQQKQNGSFDYNSLMQSFKAIEGYLPVDQQEKIKQLLEKIK